jgi:hypothetical protein
LNTTIATSALVLNNAVLRGWFLAKATSGCGCGCRLPAAMTHWLMWPGLLGCLPAGERR